MRTMILSLVGAFAVTSFAGCTNSSGPKAAEVDKTARVGSLVDRTVGIYESLASALEAIAASDARNHEKIDSMKTVSEAHVARVESEVKPQLLGLAEAEARAYYFTIAGDELGAKQAAMMDPRIVTVEKRLDALATGPIGDHARGYVRQVVQKPSGLASTRVIELARANK